MSRGLKRVLIVEDDLSLRPLWESFFASQIMKYLIDWAVSCEQAVVMISEKNKVRKKYHLIVTDLFLAGSGTGVDLIKSDCVRTSGARTVLISSADRGEVAREFHLVPQTEIITKPLDLKKHYSMLLNFEGVA